ncbi:glucokinase [Microbulbifer sp. TYP-18]|uniref:glucokinase n=1 Tax=Microbulbifer sp. TYP-18 TaxID=3230024 RepID=UPI0034C63E17
MTSIVADIGGTNARFAIARASGDGYRLEELKVADCKRFGGFDGALQHWLEGLQQPAPRQACIAVAGPVDKTAAGGRVYMTNLGWHICADKLRKQFGFTSIQLINDFAALAQSLPLLSGEDYQVLRDQPRPPGAAMAVLGPGTGLGVAGLVWGEGRYHVLAGEGGHANLAASTEREAELLRIIGSRQRPVFNEWVLSGCGLVNLYSAVCELNGQPAEALEPPDISGRGLEGSDPMCRQTLLDFLNFLGSAAGDVALYLGARGGVFLGGGILPRIVELLPQSEFEQRFLNKGRVEDWMRAVPLYALKAGYQALIGAAVQLRK